MDEEHYLRDRLEDQIEWYDAKSQWNQKWFKRLQVFQLIAAASIPFLAGYIAPDGFWRKFTVGVLGLTIAAAGAVAGFYKFQENWIEYRTTCEALRHEKYLFLTKTEPYDAERPFDLLVKRVEAQISKENSNWSQYIKMHKKQIKSV
ncbi:MAG: DUF4231 domain-containing protein [Gammaproteobacteria bacterium]|nr:DUF4231 domain-containing protein [Gammaproteobacteria bacterium]